MSKKIVNGIFIFSVIIFVLSILLFIPNIRMIIIRFGEIFIVHRPLNNPAWHRILINFGIASLLFFSLVMIGIFFFVKEIYTKTINIINKDLIILIKKSWLDIPSIYKKSFSVIFLGLNIVFMLHTANFMWGNHEWAYLSSKIGVFSLTYLGRYFSYALSDVFYDGLFLPILENLLGFAFFSVSSIMLCFYWKLPKSTLLYSITGLLFVLQPYTLSWMYFAIGTSVTMQIGFFTLIGFISGDKAFKSDSKIKKLGFVFTAALSFWFTIGTYPVVVSTIAVIFIGKLIVELTSQEYQNKNIIQIIMGHLWTIISIVIAVCLHFIVVIYLKRTGLIQDNYMTGILGLGDIPIRILQVAKTALGYLLDYKVAFFPRFFTLLFTILLIVSLFTQSAEIIGNKKLLKSAFINILFFIILLFAALVFSFTSNFITKTDTFFLPRIDFFGIAYFHMLVVVILFRQKTNFIKNISLFICIFLIHICAIQDFYAMKVWKLSFDAEKMEWNRIISRIETTPDYQDDKNYHVIILGTTQAYYNNFYQGEYTNFEHLRPYMAGWGSAQMGIFHTYTKHSKNGIWRQVSNDWSPDEFLGIINLIANEVEDAEAWPSLQSIFIKDDIMFIALSNDYGELDKVKELVKEYSYTRLFEYNPFDSWMAK